MQVSLNALRVFLVAAETGSFRDAAARLSVTPGAVSQQVRGLEDRLGTALFLRHHNSLELTPAGAQLARQAAPGLEILDGAVEAVTRDASELVLRVGVTMATRWLIPRLDAFRTRHPEARLRLETMDGVNPSRGSEADVTIYYVRARTIPEDAHLLFDDLCRPYLSPGLLARLVDPAQIDTIPALQCTADNWDWADWLQQAGLGGTHLTIAGHFQVDDPALRAAVAGLGMVLAPRVLVQDDIAAGHLCPLPGAPDVLLGHHVVRLGARQTLMARHFLRWLREIA